MSFHRRTLFTLAAGLVWLGLAASPVRAQDASAFIANLGAQAMQVLGPSVPAQQRAARFRQLLDADFDLPTISRFVLGPHARSMSPEQQQEFVPLFREYIVKAYTARLEPYGGAPFHVTGSRVAGN